MISWVSISQANRQNCEVVVTNLAAGVSSMGSTHLFICRGISREGWHVGQRAGSPGRRLGEQKDLGVQAPSLRNSPIVVAILQGHHGNSFCLQSELSAREILGPQQQSGTAEACSF